MSDTEGKERERSDGDAVERPDPEKGRGGGWKLLREAVEDKLTGELQTVVTSIFSGANGGNMQMLKLIVEMVREAEAGRETPEEESLSLAAVLWKALEDPQLENGKEVERAS